MSIIDYRVDILELFYDLTTFLSDQTCNQDVPITFTWDGPENIALAGSAHTWPTAPLRADLFIAFWKKIEKSGEIEKSHHHT